MDSVTNIALRKKKEYEDAYQKYCKETGRIMHGSAMKAIACDLAIHCASREDLYVLRRIYAGRAAVANGEKSAHGFNFYVQAFDDILNEMA